jgi:carbon monoxide dehydrogenase subunit G
MLIEGTFTVAAHIDTVWALIQDMRQVSSCMPGAENVEEVEPDVYRGALRSRVGAVSAAFEGTARIDERDAPTRMVASIQAEDRRLASSVTATFVCQLTLLEAGTRIDYEVDMAIRGRLAQVGYAAVQQTARRMTAQFAECLQGVLTDAD